MLTYRRVYGAARERLERYYAEEAAGSVRADPLRGLRFDDGVTADPGFNGLVREAVEDAIAGRRPRW